MFGLMITLLLVSMTHGSIVVERYAEEMVRLYGEDYDWKIAKIDLVALYISGGGKRHGR
jgi:hypothetical protein